MEGERPKEEPVFSKAAADFGGLFCHDHSQPVRLLLTASLVVRKCWNFGETKLKAEFHSAYHSINI